MDIKSTFGLQQIRYFVYSNIYLILSILGDCDTLTVVKQSQSKVEALCRKVLEQQSKTIAEVQELKEMIAEQRKKNFSLKQSGYEVFNWHLICTKT